MSEGKRDLRTHGFPHGEDGGDGMRYANAVGLGLMAGVFLWLILKGLDIEGIHIFDELGDLVVSTIGGVLVAASIIKGKH